MRNTPSGALRRTWLSLLGLALANTGIAMSAGLSLGTLTLVLSLTLLKARLVVLDFLELRATAPLLRWCLLAWPASLAVLALAKFVWLASRAA